MGSTVFMALGCGGADRMWIARGGGRPDVGYGGGGGPGQWEIESPFWPPPHLENEVRAIALLREHVVAARKAMAASAKV